MVTWMKIFLTGAAGFIGSAVARQLIRETSTEVVGIDKLTYAGNVKSLAEAGNDPRFHLEVVDICDAAEISRLFAQHKPDAVMHLAAESHVDRSIDGPGDFIRTNIDGTFVLLHAARAYWSALPEPARSAFRFHHISTDEVYGSLGPEGLFTEETPYQPNSPYSASKAASDHLVRAWHHTYGMPTLVTNCSNNYGPYQFPEKLIPLMILNAAVGKPLPVYGKGDNIRDWLYVDDHARALRLVLEKGKVGETYNIGGHNEKTNLEVVHTICALMDELRPDSPHAPHSKLIKYVTDRPATTTATPSTPARSAASWASTLARPSRPASARPSSGISTSKTSGARTSSPAGIARRDWDWGRNHERHPHQAAGVVILEPRIFRDDRGYFYETWSRQRYADAGLPADFVQDNVSYSIHGVLRGLHYQHPTAQGSWSASCGARFLTWPWISARVPPRSGSGKASRSRRRTAASSTSPRGSPTGSS